MLFGKYNDIFRVQDMRNLLRYNNTLYNKILMEMDNGRRVNSIINKLNEISETYMYV